MDFYQQQQDAIDAFRKAHDIKVARQQYSKFIKQQQAEFDHIQQENDRNIAKQQAEFDHIQHENDSNVAQLLQVQEEQDYQVALQLQDRDYQFALQLQQTNPI